MWPFSFTRAFAAQRDVLRIGREEVQLWRVAGSGLVFVDSEPLPQGEGCSAQGLRAAVAALLGRAAAGRPVELVVESAWLPVMLVEPGALLLNRDAVEALVRHRIEQVYGSEPDDAWEIMLDHRPGERFGVGNALSTAVRAALQVAAREAKCDLVALQPALAWGRERLGRQLPKTGWLAWREQDRQVLAYLVGGRVHALNAAAAVAHDASQARRRIEIEAVRQGVAGPMVPLTVCGWDVAAGGGVGIQWLSVAAAESRRPAASIGSVVRGHAA